MRDVVKKTYYFLLRLYVCAKACRIRKNKIIKVVFVLNEVAVWKTELLYLSMLKHKRFSPILAVTPSPVQKDFHLQMISYLKYKKYDFILLDTNKTIVNQLHPDILLYQKPYDNCVPQLHIPKKNRSTLMIHVPYGFHNIVEPWSMNKFLYLYCWQYYHENELCAQATIKNSINKGNNVVITGIPMMDELLKPREEYIDPWKDKNKRFRIIYAPHHTILKTLSGISYSTFLDYSEFILALAKKYSQQTYWAFKPHPFLKFKLDEIWGLEKSNRYYKEWETLENGQVEDGQYTALFKYSDALIHDCSTFTQEYMYINKPALYLLNNDNEQKHTENLNDFAKATFNLHVHACDKDDIENFVLDIISGRDVKKEKREEFYKESLLPPNNKNACINIINAILGEEDYA